MQSLTTTIGTFKAVCKKAYWTPDLVAVMATDADTTQSKWDKKLGCNVFLTQCSEEFTDRAEFEAHMRERHGKRKSSGDLTPWSQDIKRGWNPPRLKDEGQPFKPSTKPVAEVIKTCSTCGLIAEVDDRAASVMWWDEHERLCVGSMQDVA